MTGQQAAFSYGAVDSSAFAASLSNVAAAFFCSCCRGYSRSTGAWSRRRLIGTGGFASSVLVPPVDSRICTGLGHLKPWQPTSYSNNWQYSATMADSNTLTAALIHNFRRLFFSFQISSNIPFWNSNCHLPWPTIQDQFVRSSLS